MRKTNFTLWLSIVGAILLIGGGLIWLLRDEYTPTNQPLEGSAPPSLVVNQVVIDEGNVAYNKPVQTTFQLKNVGGQLLTLSEPQVELVEGC